MDDFRRNVPHLPSKQYPDHTYGRRLSVERRPRIWADGSENYGAKPYDHRLIKAMKKMMSDYKFAPAS